MEYQPSLLDLPPREPKFFGEMEPQDVPRIRKAHKRFMELVSDGAWRTLEDVAKTLGMSQTAASARWRDLKYINRRYEKKRDEKIAGLWHYRLEI